MTGHAPHAARRYLFMEAFVPSLPRSFTTDRKILLVVGHYGSGKTNVAVNLALAYAAAGEKTALADIDIVNPYFRATDDVRELEEAGVLCVMPEFANTNLDIPSLPAALSSLCDGTVRAILDAGGDEDGAAALGGLRDRIAATGYEMLFVINACRPLTATPTEARELLREIEARCGLSATCVVDNTNLGDETDPSLLLSSEAYARETAALCGLPLAFRSVLHTVPFPDDGRLFRMRQMTKRAFDLRS